MPSLSINALANCFVLALYLPRLIQRIIFYFYTAYKQKNAIVQPLNEATAPKTIHMALHNIPKIFMANRFLFLSVVFAITRSLCTLFSSKFTASMNFQLIALTQPFIVTVSSVLLCKLLPSTSKLLPVFLLDRMSRAMIVAMIVTVIGGALLILGTASVKAFPDSSFQLSLPVFLSPGASMNWLDLIGLALAFFSALLNSWYSICIKTAIVTGQDNPWALNVSTENLIAFQTVSVTIFYSCASLIMQDDWSYLFTQGSIASIALFCLYTFFSYILCNILLVVAISLIGASDTSLPYALSLITSVILGWIIIDEKINNIWQIVGGIVVLVSITSMVFIKRAQQQKALPTETELVDRKRKIFTIYGVDEEWTTKLAEELEYDYMDVKAIMKEHTNWKEITNKKISELEGDSFVMLQNGLDNEKLDLACDYAVVLGDEIDQIDAKIVEKIQAENYGEFLTQMKLLHEKYVQNEIIV